MNRTILIVICDFLLVTLVAFSNFDAEEAPKAETRVMTGSKPVGGNADMVGTLKIALKVGELHEDEASFILDQVARLNAGEGEIEAVRRAIALQLRILAERRARAGAAAPGGSAATPMPASPG